MHVDDPLRERLWAAKERRRGFEDVLADLQGALESRFDAQTEQDLRNLTNAINAMFAEMSEGYGRTNFEPQNEVVTMVKTFLGRFDAIYTLNQDTLIEQKYAGPLTGSRFNSCILPGLKSANSVLAIGRSQFPLYTPDSANFKLTSDNQPYIKLHGSFGWIYDGRDLLLILGGNKAINIKKHPLLAWYHKRFQDDLRKPETRLMIVGYSFNDAHINDAILKAIDQSDLRIFIIDPLGVDVLDKRDPKAAITQPPMDLLTQLSPRIIGASRRPLTTTFGVDMVEHAKVMKFFR